MTQSSTKTTHFSVTDEGFTIHAELKRINSDILIILTGGDVPHIGSVTTLSKGKIESTVFLCHDGKPHKDHLLAEKIMATIQHIITENCVITSGVHVDYITKQQIIASLEMAENISQQIITWLQNSPLKEQKPIYYS